MSTDDARPDEVPYSVMLPGHPGRSGGARDEDGSGGEETELPEVRPIFYVSGE